MNDNCNKILYKTLDLSHAMMLLANEGDNNREDIGCGVLFGTLRDYAYKLRALAELEIAEHKKHRKGLENISLK